ncbi:MAG: dihydroneopterin aldolase [Pseudomonadales bacterium]
MGILFIRDLPVECVIGVHPHERNSRQRLLISIELRTSFRDAAATDDLAHALDYVALAETIERIATDGRFRLIEALAERIADALFDPRMQRLEVEVRKPAALPRTPHVGVRTCRPSEETETR